MGFGLRIAFFFYTILTDFADSQMSDISVVFNDFLLAVHVCHKCLLLTYIDITYNDHQVNVGVCMSFTLPFLLSRDMGKKKMIKVVWDYHEVYV